MTDHQFEQIEWQHPRLGRVSEPVCLEHSTEVLRALKVLGIGCGGQVSPFRTCLRCRYGYRYLMNRDLDATRASVSVSLPHHVPVIPPALFLSPATPEEPS